jgi:putative hydrolase of the HAD superfamily
MFTGIRAIVFDLDGTLYVNKGLADEINLAACGYIGALRGISPKDAASLIMKTRERLSRENGEEITLSAVCTELGGDAPGFHRVAVRTVHPESHLVHDDRVVSILTALAERFDLYIYTNNNRTLTDRVLATLGIPHLFRDLFTIEYLWKPKPNRLVLEKIFTSIGRNPTECLFVGDRYDIDLRLPEQMGCPIFPVKEIQDLLRLAPALTGNRIEP